ncbi:hypothetical protein ABW21_db0209905 [Orbilia brochopaga]|nr:hypothetical protein ABW21_db0209905 [Drechslerella brochopaga]
MKTGKQFIIDWTHSKPILISTFEAIGSGDPAQMDALISDSGYDLSVDSLEEARSAAASGAHFNISAAGGVYNIDQPQDLKDHILMVDPLHGRIYIDGKMKQNRTTPDGKVVWSDAGDKYTITFSIEYDEDHNPKPITFSGQRENREGGQDKVSGTQKRPGTGFFNNPFVLSAGLLCTVSGFTVYCCIGDLIKYIKGDKGAGTSEVQRAREYVAMSFRELSRLYDPPAFDYTVPSLRADLEQTIERSVNQSLDSHDHTDTAIREKASAAAIDYLEKRVESTLHSEYQERFHGFTPLLSDTQYQRVLSDAEREALKRQIGDRRDGLSPEGAYLQSCVEYFSNIRTERLAQEKGAMFQDAMDHDKQEAQRNREQATSKEKAKQNLIDQKNAETDAAKKAELEQKIQDLEKEIKKLEAEAESKEKDAKDAKDHRDRELETEEEAKKKAEDEKKKKDRHAEAVYKA